ncbi:hypothetical protein [Nocardia thailandica]|uniref:hypothetical protein n=1 Tax=Nocardia thailandica TaxID=257275 RepID=UPI0002EFF9C3|nr:hypothetical protein [Nocardia thailandica]
MSRSREGAQAVPSCGESEGLDEAWIAEQMSHFTLTDLLPAIQILRDFARSRPQPGRTEAA